MENQPGGEMKNRLGTETATLSEIFPMMGARNDLVKKGYIKPVIIVLIYLAVLGALYTNPTLFRDFFGLGLGLLVFYLLYRVCGKRQPWWLPAGAGLVTVVSMSTPIWLMVSLIFYGIPGTPQGAAFARMSLPEQIIRNIISTGGAEELMKILPVFLFWLIGRKRVKPFVTEPLDAILFAAASALGFVFVETLGEYGPKAVAQVAGNLGKLGAPSGLARLAGEVFGLETVILRVLPAFTGHMAYSGYFGYFVGLAALKPKHALKLILIGFGCSALMHGIWDSFCDLPRVGLYLQLPMSVGFYALLIAAVLRARQISPTRSQNFATAVINIAKIQEQARAAAAPARPPAPAPVPAPVVVRPATAYQAPKPAPQVQIPQPPPPPKPQPPARSVFSPPPPAAPATMRLHVGNQILALRDGERILEAHIPGLRSAAGDGVVAAVTHNPNDPSMLGLQNLSTNTWRAILPGPEAREIPCGRAVRLASTSRFDFGPLKGEVL